jgi:hypothetical protein
VRGSEGFALTGSLVARSVSGPGSHRGGCLARPTNASRDRFDGCKQAEKMSDHGPLLHSSDQDGGVNTPLGYSTATARSSDFGSKYDTPHTSAKANRRLLLHDVLAPSAGKRSTASLAAPSYQRCDAVHPIHLKEEDSHCTFPLCCLRRCQEASLLSAEIRASQAEPAVQSQPLPPSPSTFSLR